MSDGYDAQIERLTREPGRIFGEWFSADGLFQMASSTGDTKQVSSCVWIGCLTQIRSGLHVAENAELTKQIKSDERLPSNHREITPAHLPVFAEWQRRLDRELGRKPYGGAA